MKKLLIPIAFVVLIAALLLALSSTPDLRVEPPVQVVGIQTPVKLSIADPHGVRRIAARLEQGDTEYDVYESNNPATRLFFLGKHEPPRDVVITIGTKQAPKLKDGKARLTIDVTSNDFRGSTASAAFDVVINTKPPTLYVDPGQHYINQGGSELVTFTVSGYWTEAGVRVGNYTFRSFPIPGRKSDDPSRSDRFSIFVFPWNVPADTVPVVYVRNPAGAEATARFWYKLFPKNFRVRDLELSDSFLDKVVNQIDPGGSGDLITRFLKINGEMRRENNHTLAELREKSEPKFLWRTAFQQLGNSKVESMFADTRNYIYKGKKVDQQTHLGFDLSVTQGVAVTAANDGRVVWAQPLGIYGNCIVVDHGYGVQSIYGHLSRIDVKAGDMVKKGQTMGRSGSTGLAGGDHLHFSMQVDGVQANPVEWWDEHWIQDHIFSRVPPPQS